jgi:sigma-B regulation protein RsbU (phosphoserine phosphatase)
MPSPPSSVAERPSPGEVSTEEALEAFYAALLDDDAEALYERAPCGYLSTTVDGTIVKVNRTFLTWTGYARSDLVGRRTFAELLTAGGRIYHETHYAPMLLMQGTAREIAFDIVRADGERVPALVNSVLERDATGAPLVVRTAIFDATDRREYERELLRAKQLAEESEAKARVLAQTLQQTLIPPTPPATPGLDIAAAYRPAGTGDEVGGDFYDIFEIAVDDWVIAIGDVCGKGVEAAIVTALARSTIRSIAIRHPDPREILSALNETLVHHESNRFCTVAVMRLRQEGKSWRVFVGLGGHPQPVVLPIGAQPERFGRPGTLLGVFDDVHVDQSETLLHAGDAMVLYTDGVTEGRSGGEFYGETRLLAAIERNRESAGSLTDGILEDVLRFQDGYPRDDIALVTVRVPLG